ncbi:MULTISPECIES: MBL fold metallo-hydrolase [unclassified Streptomyces]|uniref:MBL fold metallo-hydrolase n=1 Tax=unclassified Streptomyces TaxID=2593676 RepID=UPI0032478841
MKKTEALRRAVRWPGVPDRLLVVLAQQLLATHQLREGYDHFAALSAERPESALVESLAGAFEARLDGPDEKAFVRLDAAASRDLGLPQYFRGTVLAGFPDCAGRADTVISDLEFILAVRDRLPAGFLHSVHAALARAYACQGRAEDARAARARIGHGPELSLVTENLVSPEDGLRMAPPRLVEMAPGVHVAQGYDFADFAFVVTGEGVVAIDAASHPRHAAAALRDLRAITDAPITHVILTHAHFDHIGGLEALTGATSQVIAQAGFPDELRLQAAGPPPFRSLLPADQDGIPHVVPDRLVDRPETLTVGETRFTLVPIGGGETSDGLLIHLPDEGVVFTGDMCMPYLGAPFFPEGSPAGLLDALGKVQDLRPRLLVHGHTALTENFTIESFPGLLASLRDLHAVVADDIAAGRTLTDVLDRDHLPEVLRDHPVAVLPYLAIRDGFVQRVYDQGTGYWKADGEGVEPLAPEQWAAALDLLGGGKAEAFVAAGEELLTRDDPAAALRIVDCGLLSHPDDAALGELRRRLLLVLVERNQFFDPFKFAYYAGLAGLTVSPAG